MSIDNIKTLYTFTVNLSQEVDEVTSREEDGKTITETVKVQKVVPIYFAVKRPSRAEREAAEEERAIWWSYYVDKGIKTEAILTKLYANSGGTASDDQKKRFFETRAALLTKMEEYEILKITSRDDKDKLAQTRLELVTLRDQIIKFEQDQATFFENTAESKARIKLAEWLITHLSYSRDSEDKPWTIYFAGTTNEQRMALMESREDSNDELYRLAQPQLYFIVSFLISSNFTAVQSDIDSYLNEPQ